MKTVWTITTNAMTGQPEMFGVYENAGAVALAFEAVADHNYEYAQANADLAPAKMLDEWNNSFELYQSSPT